MEGKIKKLALWHTKTFRPILNHDDLEPLMMVLGFEALPVVQSPTGKGVWKEYAFHVARSSHEEVDERCLRGERLRGEREHCEEAETRKQHPQHPVRPRLPFPRIDGLHLLTYNAFIDAVGFHIGVDKVPDHFHVRSMPVHRVHDRPFDRTFRRMSDDRRGGEEDRMLVYRDGTLDQATLLSPAGGVANSVAIKDTSASSTCMVSLKEILPPAKHIAV